MEFFEEQIKISAEALQMSIFDRREGFGFTKEDPAEELEEVYVEIEQLESQFKECVKICSFIIEKDKELIEEKNDMHYQVQAA